MTDTASTHFVAIVGGATAAAEVASRLAERGISVAVFEQNTRPFGKIEDGLPRWHEGLRRKEFENIRKKLSLPGVHFIPRTKIGRDVAFKELVNDWGFTSVILANGAWRDRPLPIENADNFIGRGLVYQNTFVIAFNHEEDAQNPSAPVEVHDDSIVVGGGLASIDVAKIITLKLTRQALADRNIKVGITELEVKGIPKTLAKHDIAWEDLGLAGCTIYYRRRLEDMPLVAIAEDATEERIAKVKKSRQTLLNKASEKFKFKVEPLSAPDGLLLEDDQLVGLRFRRTEIRDGRVCSREETYERYAPAVISSIGSIPESIEGIPMKGELFDFADWNYGRIADFPTVFSVGNVVTGKGNIVASRKHAALVSQEAIEIYLGVADQDENLDPDEIFDAASAEATATEVAEHSLAQPPLDERSQADLLERIRDQQQAVGYPGNLKEWLESVGEAN